MNPLSLGSKIQLHTGKTPNSEWPRYDNELSYGAASVLYLWGRWSTLTFSLLPGPL